MSEAEFPVARFLGSDGVVQRVRLAAYGWCEADEAGPGGAGEGNEAKGDGNQAGNQHIGNHQADDNIVTRQFAVRAAPAAIE